MTLAKLVKNSVGGGVILISLAVTGTAQAAILSYGGVGATQGLFPFGNGPVNIGRQFTVTGSGITVIDLGVFDLGGNGLVDPHDVTLFKINSGAGAANANVSAITGGSVNIASGTGASLESSFRFKALTNPIYLAPGNYSVIAYGLKKFGDPYGEGGQLPTGGNVSNIGFTPFQYVTASSPAYPSSGDANTALSSASFRYNLGNTTSVPEPSAILGLLALGTLGAASTLKRQLKPSKSTEKATTKVG
ncbi:PEP-CTERM sorting domain-containing protein [Microcystis aeruginosa]|uniref:PEP-CTERM sorting domain-containing protein n=1 Tax=Microcystis aeruginosa TaxID=1126 RepID=UPI001D14AD3E|nr:PEP-CTERM sorting domain-containing protein [Microcystis aeruginosa]